VLHHCATYRSKFQNYNIAAYSINYNLPCVNQKGSFRFSHPTGHNCSASFKTPSSFISLTMSKPPISSPLQYSCHGTTNQRR